VFFVANNQGYPKLRLDFHGRPITFGEVRTEKGKPLQGEVTKRRLEHMRPSDRCIKDITKRTEGRGVSFNTRIIHDSLVADTLVSGSVYIRAYDKNGFSDGDCVNISTFPQDYDFDGNSPKYVCGMSVPPNMMANIATQIWEQWLSKEV
jgi:DNA (cytosine-5)-methyltransferase 1